jgi:hypothetical protein
MNPMVAGRAPGQRGKGFVLTFSRNSRRYKQTSGVHGEARAVRDGPWETGVQVESALSNWVKAEVINFFDSL